MAGRWRRSPPISAVTAWHTVNRAVVTFGTALIGDPGRIGPVTTLGLDETAFVRLGPYKHRIWSTQLVATDSCSTWYRGVTRRLRALGSPGVLTHGEMPSSG